MSTNLHRRPIRLAHELLIGSVTVVGLLLILGAFLLPPGDARDVVRGIGLSLFPAGVVAFLLSRFAASLTEILIRQTIESTIRERLQEDMEKIESTVREGMTKIAATVSKEVDEVEAEMERLSPLLASASKLGLENVALTRAEALKSFAWFLDAECQKAERGEPARVWIVSSSIKGFLEASAEYFDGRRMMERIVRSNCELRIMMTDPDIADLRAKQEQRAKGEIPNEIRMNLAYLKRIGVKRETVRFYPGTPTVFAVATMDRMLLNPYPYQTEAFRCFSLTVYKTLNPQADIYHQYLRYHFEEPWDRALEIPLDVWNQL